MTSKQINDTNQLRQLDENPNHIEMYLNAVFNNSKDPLFIKDDECRLLLVNDAFCSMFGLPRNKIIGKTLAETVTPSEREHFLSIDRQVLEQGKEILCEETLTFSGEQTKIILTRKNRYTDPQGNYFLVGTIYDITARKQTELRETSRTHVLELITSGEVLPVILASIVSAVEQLNPDMLCSILLLDNAGKHLLSGTASSLPDFYNEAIHGIEIGIGVGSCGTAAFKNERVIVDDIQTHPYWVSYKELANNAGLGACWSEPIRSTTGKVLGTFAIYHHDVNIPTEADLVLIEQSANLASIAIEKKQAEEKLKRAASVFSHAHEGIMITDANAIITEVNATFSQITGYSPEDVLGKNPNILQSTRQTPEFYAEMWAALHTQDHWRGEIWNRRKNGEIYPEILTISAVKNSAGIVQHYVSLCTDITSMKAHQNQLEHIAHFDLLTNLPNRVLLADRLSQAMLHCKRHEQSLAVVFLDLDGFKHVNDSNGHNIGDELLIALSVRMKKALREGDSLARIGGDEFVAVLTDLNTVEDCEPVLERLLLAASKPITVGGVVLNVSASIGVTLYPQDSVDADQLMRHADQAMYVAKESGKNRFHLFDTAQDDAMKAERESLEAIRSALDNHQFVLHYQPKVNMRSGKVTGVEALIRWQHPVRGLLNPIEFLPIIENNPMIVEIGEWVIHSALTQINLWQNMRLNLPLFTSVNIAAVQLQQPDFTQRLTTLLTAHPNVLPSYLELEVLETSALDDVNHVSTIMHACMALGVSFALDDFGTGYSSLTYLRRLPANLIKIDQSFVRDMLIDADDLAIVKGVIALAKLFNREVIAEGVETIEHGTALLQLGCELAQGYGIARPMPADDIPQWVSNWKANEAWQV
tara:strand:+ start:12510 stop:15125 length:2616 start_codon:yes stop_codon:yes gene_type:complete